MNGRAAPESLLEFIERENEVAEGLEKERRLLASSRASQSELKGVLRTELLPYQVRGAIFAPEYPDNQIALAESAIVEADTDASVAKALTLRPELSQLNYQKMMAAEMLKMARAAYLPQVNFVSNYYYGNAFSTAGRKPLTAATGGTGACGATVSRACWWRTGTRRG